MSVENPLWGAPRIHGELLKLGFEVAQSSVAKYMVERHGPPSQGWRTFLRNHAPDIAAMDLFIVPTIGFNLLYAFVVVRLNRRERLLMTRRRHHPPLRRSKNSHGTRTAQGATAASIASPNRSTITSTAVLSMMNGGASSTWSPRLPSAVPPIG
jgi:hypothetical protein